MATFLVRCVGGGGARVRILLPVLVLGRLFLPRTIGVLLVRAFWMARG